MINCDFYLRKYTINRWIELSPCLDLIRRSKDFEPRVI